MPGNGTTLCSSIPLEPATLPGVWERIIDSIKKSFDASVRLSGKRLLAREEFATLMVEVLAIVNNIPLAEVSFDPNNPFPVCHAALLNLWEIPNPPFSICYTIEGLICYRTRRWRRVQFFAD